MQQLKRMKGDTFRQTARSGIFVTREWTQEIRPPVEVPRPPQELESPGECWLHKTKRTRKTHSVIDTVFRRCDVYISVFTKITLRGKYNKNGRQLTVLPS